MDYRKIYAIKKEREKQILKLCNVIGNYKSGIYLFYRWSKEKKKWCCYVGQATKSMLERCASHLDGYKSKNPSHIDKSLKTHGVYSLDNPDGWKLKILCVCPAIDCNHFEQQYIDAYRNLKDVELYNITIGSQGKGKVDFQERSQEKLKRYRNGKTKGQNAILKKVKTFFDKYLDYIIKGKETKIKQRKLKEFEELLKGENESE